MRTNILVLTPQVELPPSSSITNSLKLQPEFSVTVATRISSELLSVENVPQVAIVIWSSNLDQAVRSLDARTSLLFVFDSTAAIPTLNGPTSAATDFLFTPFAEKELLFRLRRLIEKSHRHTAVQEAAQACALAQLIGDDPQFASLKRRIPVVARFDSTVLLTGETGTGKERFARALHYSSPRADKPFLPVNCGAIPLDLFESELYGHRRGAFTGAVNGQPGLIAEAEGGTLFLDEVETLSLASQVKLLRFLQDQVYYPVGSAKPKQANVWILASTNIELPLKIQDGTFREDLYYRLAVISLALPPLRQRPGDIPLLASHFWRIYSARAGRKSEPLPSNILAALSRHNWPGNVRELQNVIQQLAVSESELLQPRDLMIPHAEQLADAKPASFAQRKALVIADFEKSYLTELLRTHQGNVTHAALEAKKDRRALGRLIKKHRIARQESS
ncbi:MAG TPA: sigma 54-interacting transcriptional regulator [Pyrinomonadaceae bacterium]|nr:sigma 54-interacting transcriptional regulator [Pyrinomonadaceae bacterium]